MWPLTLYVIKYNRYRRLDNEGPHNLYASPYIIWVKKSKRMRWAGREARTGGMRNAYKILAEDLAEKRPLGRSRRRREDAIRTDLRKIGWEGMNRMYQAQDRDQWRALVNTVMNIRVP
jgi:hypothetical protein